MTDTYSDSPVLPVVRGGQPLRGWQSALRASSPGCTRGYKSQPLWGLARSQNNDLAYPGNAQPDQSLFKNHKETCSFITDHEIYTQP